MHINWMALLQVTMVTLIASVALVGLVSLGARCLDSAKVRRASGASASASALRVGAWGLFSLAGLAMVFGLYLMIPYFH
jgi:hypothetical protein